MITQKLVETANAHLLAGKSVEETKQLLATDGWSSHEIEEAFLGYPQNQTPEYKGVEGEMAGNKKGKFILIATAILLAIGLSAFLYLKTLNKADSEAVPLKTTTEDKLVAPEMSLKKAADEKEIAIKNEEVPVKKLPKLPSLPNLNLIIETSKDSYEVNESFEGDFSIDYQGTPFKAVILYSVFKDDLQVQSWVSTDTILSNMFSKTIISAFSISPSNEFENYKQEFTEPGKYTYKILIYKCSDLGFNDKDCNHSLKEEYLKGFNPIATGSKTITVVPATVIDKEAVDQTESSLNLAVSIEIPKDTYQLNEPFEGKLISTVNEGESSPYMIFVILERDELEHISVYNPIFNEDAYSTSFDHPLKAFSLNDTSYQYSVNSFNIPGKYTFTYQAYQANGCSDLNMDVFDCGLRLKKENLKDFTPIATVSKTFTVLPEEYNKESKTAEGSVLDCVGSTDENCMTPFLNDFTNNLASCSVSTGTTPVGFEPFMSLLRGYEIKGQVNDNCVIDFWFLDTSIEKISPYADAIPAELLNKKMTCSLADDQRTIEAVGERVGCEGPLKVELDKMDI